MKFKPFVGVALALVALLITSPALAKEQAKAGKSLGGWADTRWGMTEADLKKLYPGKIEKASEEYQAKGWALKMEGYQFEGQTYTVYFTMTDGKLASVTLTTGPSESARDDQYRKLSRMFEQKYGPPTSQDPPEKFPPRQFLYSTEWELKDTKIALVYVYSSVLTSKGLYAILLTYEAQEESDSL